jgi:hypothetical protein
VFILLILKVLVLDEMTIQGELLPQEHSETMEARFAALEEKAAVSAVTPNAKESLSIRSFSANLASTESLSANNAAKKKFVTKTESLNDVQNTHVTPMAKLENRALSAPQSQLATQKNAPAAKQTPALSTQTLSPKSDFEKAGVEKAGVEKITTLSRETFLRFKAPEVNNETRFTWTLIKENESNYIIHLFTDNQELDSQANDGQASVYQLPKALYKPSITSHAPSQRGRKGLEQILIIPNGLNK